MRLRFADCVFDPDTREVIRHGEALALSPKAFQLLHLLIRERPKAISKDALQAELWPDTFVSEANLANLIADLRAALGDDARNPRIIRTIHRFGYAFQAPDEDDINRIESAAPKTSCRLIWNDREIALHAGENVLGRDEQVTVWIDVHSVSRRHARILLAGDDATIEDLASKNGTFVHDTRIVAPVLLRDLDVIRLGTVQLLFRQFRHPSSTATVHSRA
jgi:DNA-binding winged helix-turn-helix (wHTH) protein